MRCIVCTRMCIVALEVCDFQLFTRSVRRIRILDKNKNAFSNNIKVSMFDEYEFIRSSDLCFADIKSGANVIDTQRTDKAWKYTYRAHALHILCVRFTRLCARRENIIFFQNVACTMRCLRDQTYTQTANTQPYVVHFVCLETPKT